MKGTWKLDSLLLAGSLLAATAALAEAPVGQYDGVIQAKLTQQLGKKQFKEVSSSVQDGVVTLEGTVDTYQHKLDAARKAGKEEHVTAVRDQVQVADAGMSDAALRQRLAQKLAYDRVGYDNVFNVLAVEVKDGVATVGGEVRDYVDRDSAISAVASTPGVKAVVDNVKVAPASFADDQLRVRIARAIYRDPVLSKYAMDPQAPIRIVVDGGRVGLYGTVDSSMDRTVAGMRANEVFGAFQVDNHLTTAIDTVR
ncbi:MAG: BON domain-containing protein [Terriglobales bacterium]